MKKYSILDRAFGLAIINFEAKNDQVARKISKKYYDAYRGITIRKQIGTNYYYVNFKKNYDKRYMKYPRKLKKEKQKQFEEIFTTTCDELFRSNRLMLTFQNNECLKITVQMLEKSLMKSDVPSDVKKLGRKILRSYK